MLVYGDHERTVDPRELLVRLAEPAHGHAAVVARFIAAAELAQGLADATFTGIDARSPLTDAAMRACVGFARQVEQSWRGMPASVRTWMFMREKSLLQRRITLWTEFGKDCPGGRAAPATICTRSEGRFT